MTPFETLSATSRVWIFPLSRALTGPEASEILRAAREFAASWKAHGKPVVAEAALSDEQFLIVAADLERSEVSGCSIDALHRSVTELTHRYGCEVVTPRDVIFQENGQWTRVPRAEFARLAQSGAVTPDTKVINGSIVALEDVRAGKWRTRAADSWHQAAFFSA